MLHNLKIWERKEQCTGQEIGGDIVKFLVVNKGKMTPPPDRMVGMLDALEAWEQRYSAGGKLQAWGFSGTPGGAGILEVDSLEELDEIVMASPVSPFSEIEIYPLIDLHDAVAHGKNAVKGMMAGMRQ